MITTKDIVTAVNRRIKEVIPGAVIKSTDFRKNVVPGAFYQEYPKPTFDGTEYFRHESGTIRIYYFPTDEHNCRYELADMQEKLSMSFFGILAVNDTFVIPLNEVNFDVTDNVLVMSFDYDTWQEIAETGEDMLNLEVR